jgi:hypothetical protein
MWFPGHRGVDSDNSLAFPDNLPHLFIFSQPDKLRMSQVIIRRPLDEVKSD